MSEAEENEAITDYYFKHYAGRHCSLCGNSGIIDTTGVKTPRGIPVGKKNYCICPNGQALRFHRASEEIESQKDG